MSSSTSSTLPASSNLVQQPNIDIAQPVASSSPTIAASSPSPSPSLIAIRSSLPRQKVLSLDAIDTLFSKVHLTRDYASIDWGSRSTPETLKLHNSNTNAILTFLHQQMSANKSAINDSVVSSSSPAGSPLHEALNMDQVKGIAKKLGLPPTLPIVNWSNEAQRRRDACFVFAYLLAQCTEHVYLHEDSYIPEVKVEDGVKDTQRLDTKETEEILGGRAKYAEMLEKLHWKYEGDVHQLFQQWQHLYVVTGNKQVHFNELMCYSQKDLASISWRTNCKYYCYSFSELLFTLSLGVMAYQWSKSTTRSTAEATSMVGFLQAQKAR